VYSDTQHTAVRILHEDLVALPRLHLMCGDFNIRHASWDPNGPEVCVHADRLMAVCDALGLTLSSPVEEGPTHFPYNEDSDAHRHRPHVRSSGGLPHDGTRDSP
jgi:hypothetical protein